MKCKYVCSFLAVLLLLIATGCTENNSDEEDNAMMPVGDQPDMVVEIQPQSIRLNDISEPLTITVRNLSAEEYRGGYEYKLEYNNNRGWTLVPAIPEFGFRSVQIIIEPGDELTQLLTLKSYDFEFVPGTYRVTYDKWHGEFTITK